MTMNYPNFLLKHNLKEINENCIYLLSNELSFSENKIEILQTKTGNYGKLKSMVPCFVFIFHLTF